MISRVAESCYWLHRYVERLENTARFLAVNSAFVLDASLPPRERWGPLLVVAGEEPRFRERHGDEAVADGEVVQESMTWDPENPVSLHNSAFWARENARTIREVISLEMWHALNGFWVWLESREGRSCWERERIGFYHRCQETAQLFRGICADGVLHEEPFDFMRLGMLIERADQTARILDVKFHTLGPTPSDGRESHTAYAQWSAILRSCAGTEAFLKRTSDFSGDAVAEFLMFDPAFPRSIRHCLDRAWNFLERIRRQEAREGAEVGARSAELLDRLRREVDTATLESVREAGGSHLQLTRFIQRLAGIDDALRHDFFDPPEEAPATEASGQ